LKEITVEDTKQTSLSTPVTEITDLIIEDSSAKSDTLTVENQTEGEGILIIFLFYKFL
jgi:hypothetical protein